jgi:hypothetical protein
MGGPNYSVGIRAMDGSAPIRLGEGYGGNFSPDGQWAITFLSGPPPKITILPTGAGEPQDVPIPGIERINSYNQGFFPDGKRIWFTGAEAGHPARTYAQQITGGAPQPITPEGISADGLSPDGKFVIAPDRDGLLAKFPIDGAAPRAVPGINPGQRFVQWSEDGSAIFVRGTGIPISVSKVDLSTGKQTPMAHLMPADPAGVAGVNTVVMSRDGKTYAYNYRRLLSELMVVEGLK